MEETKKIEVSTMIPMEIFTNDDSRENYYKSNKYTLRVFDWVRVMRGEEDEK